MNVWKVLCTELCVKYTFLIYILGQIAVKVAIETNTLYRTHGKNKTLKIASAIFMIENIKRVTLGAVTFVS